MEVVKINEVTDINKCILKCLLFLNVLLSIIAKYVVLIS